MSQTNKHLPNKRLQTVTFSYRKKTLRYCYKIVRKTTHQKAETETESKQN
jgi:hypothetical protein